ncbi:MAG: tetratricopeptide repeat protein [Clostridiales bacterium]|nr:tetratricopeptide repeat protein [Clostridiales bacterium]
MDCIKKVFGVSSKYYAQIILIHLNDINAISKKDKFKSKESIMNEEELLAVAEKYENDKLWKSAYDTYFLIYSYNTEDKILEKLAWCASRAELFSDAIVYYEIMSKRKPSVAKWFYCMGYQYYMQKDWKKSIEWFMKALELYPNYLAVKYRLGYALRQECGNFMILKKNEFWEALKQFEECTNIWNSYDEKLKKQNAKIYGDVCFQKGKMLMERDRISDAIISFKEALSIQNNDDDCKYQLSKAYLAINEPKEALNILPPNTKYYFKELKIDIYLVLDDIDTAKSLLESHIAHRKKDYLYRQLAEIYIKKEDYKAAIQQAIKAKEINKKNHLNRLLLARLFYEVGILKKALEEVEQATILKQAKYDRAFNEADQLKAKIIEKINELDYYEDNIKKLRCFLRKLRIHEMKVL